MTFPPLSPEFLPSPGMPETEKRRPESRDAIRREAQKNVGLELMEQASRMPPSPQRDGLMRAAILKHYQLHYPEAVAVMTRPDHQEFLQGAPKDDVLNMWDKTSETYEKESGLAKERKRAVEYITKKGEIADPERPSFNLIDFVSLINDELVTLGNLRSRPGLSLEQSQAIARESTYLKTMLSWYNIPSSDQILKRFGLSMESKPDDKRQSVNNEVKMVGRVLVSMVSAGMALYTAFTAWMMGRQNKEGGDYTATALWGAIALGNSYWKNLTEPRAQQVLRNTEFLSQDRFRNYLSRFKPGQLGKPMEALLEEKDTNTLAKDLIAEKGDTRSEERRNLARERLTEIISDASGDPRLAEAMLQNPRDFASFILPQLEVRNDEDAKQLTLTCIKKLAAPPPAMFKKT